MSVTVGGASKAFAEAMRCAGYEESTIAQYGKYVRELGRHAEERTGGVYTRELGEEFAGSTVSAVTGAYSPQRKVCLTRIRRAFDAFEATGVVDLSTEGRAAAEMPASDAFVALLDAWDAEMAARGLADSTCGHYWRLARLFLLYLEAGGVSDPARATPSDAIGFVASLVAGAWSGTSTYSIVTNFRPFLRFLGRQDMVDALGLVGARRKSDHVGALSDDDVARVVEACAGGLVDAAAAAVTMLALTTGLRACDIVKLELDDVDWRAMTVSVVQQKTGGPVLLPLAPAAAGCLAGYVLRHRPDTGSRRVFLRAKAPHLPYRDHAAVYAATKRALAAAGVEGAGTRLLRHSSATRMLRAGTPLPTISAVLGHADPDSTAIYMEADMPRLASCVLPLPGAAR